MSLLLYFDVDTALSNVDLSLSSALSHKTDRCILQSHCTVVLSMAYYHVA